MASCWKFDGIVMLKTLHGIISSRVRTSSPGVFTSRISGFDTTEVTFIKYVNNIRSVNVLDKTAWTPFGVPLICESRDQKQKLFQKNLDLDLFYTY